MCQHIYCIRESPLGDGLWFPRRAEGGGEVSGGGGVWRQDRLYVPLQQRGKHEFERSAVKQQIEATAGKGLQVMFVLLFISILKICM